MQKATTHVVLRHDSGATLVAFLATEMKLSRKKAKQLIDSRQVFVNGRRVWMARHTLRKGDEVDCAAAAPTIQRDRKLRVLYEDEHYVIINKPPGLLSEGSQSVELQAQAQFEQPSLQVVHRLDRDTSGCLILARHPDAFKRIVPCFRERTVKKVYHAIVLGTPRYTSQRIDKALAGQRAITHLRVLDRGKRASHLQIRIETGRTHQIRKHLAAIGLPVAGDRHYGGRRSNADAALHIPRHMLHASGITFTHPVSHELIHGRAPLPHDFKKVLSTFRLT